MYDADCRSMYYCSQCIPASATTTRTVSYCGLGAYNSRALKQKLQVGYATSAVRHLCWTSSGSTLYSTSNNEKAINSSVPPHQSAAYHMFFTTVIMSCRSVPGSSTTEYTMLLPLLLPVVVSLLLLILLLSFAGSFNASCKAV